MFALTANKINLYVTAREKLTSGSQNIYLCQFVFSDDWEGVDKTAVFSASGVERSVILGEDNECQIPWEVLERPGKDLYVGVYGTKNGELVMPTVQASLGKIQLGTKAAETTKPPTPDVYDQILAEAREAKDIAQSVRKDADNGAFDGAGIPAGGTAGQVLTKNSDADQDASWKTPTGGSGGPGGYYTPEISQTSQKEMTVSFTGSAPGMPAVESKKVSLPPGKDGAQGPKGDKGDDGAIGPQGPAGPQGPKGEDGSDATVTVDSQLSGDSTNPVQNKVVKAKFDELSGEIGHCYALLSTAIADINNDTTENALTDTSTAKVRVSKAENGRTLVTLLDDLSESVQIDINKDIDLVLNGNVLTFTVSGAHLNFTAGTNCTINGEVADSSVKHIGGSGEAVSIRNRGKLAIKGGLYSAKNAATVCSAVSIYTNAETKIEEAELVSENAGVFVRGIQAAGVLVIKNCKILCRNHAIVEGITFFGADVLIEDSELVFVCSSSSSNQKGLVNSKGYENDQLTMYRTKIRADSPNFDQGIIAVSLKGTVNIYDCDIYGMHSAISVRNGSKFYINGGIYTGFCHGGFYISNGQDGEAYINNATIRNGNYEGEFDATGQEVYLYGATYIGGGSEDYNNNINAYFDGCTFEPEAGNSIVLRGTEGETNNTLNISNSNISGTGGGIRVDAGKGHKVNVGIGGNIDASKITAGADVTMTGKLYRRNSPDKILDGNDFSAMLNGIGSEAGLSAFEIAVANGYIGTEQEWLDSLQGEQGPKGDLFPSVSVPYAAEITAAANTMTRIGQLTGPVTITLGAAASDSYDNEWDFTITQGETAQDVVLPVIHWGLGIAPTFSANSTTICRLYYVGDSLCGEWVNV